MRRTSLHAIAALLLTSACGAAAPSADVDASTTDAYVDPSEGAAACIARGLCVEAYDVPSVVGSIHDYCSDGCNWLECRDAAIVATVPRYCVEPSTTPPPACTVEVGPLNESAGPPEILLTGTTYFETAPDWSVPLAASATVVESTEDASGARVVVTAGAETLTFTIPAAHAAPELTVGEAIRLTARRGGVYGRTYPTGTVPISRFVVTTDAGVLVAAYERDGGSNAVHVNVRGLFDAMAISYAPVAVVPDCREAGGGYCGRAAIGWALALESGARAARGQTLALDASTTIAVDSLTDDNDRWPTEPVCAIYTFANVALEVHRR